LAINAAALSLETTGELMMHDLRSKWP